jgi:ABC-type Zn uptake system ZnuABC Zn-binding protein ZnuA
MLALLATLAPGLAQTPEAAPLAERTVLVATIAPVAMILRGLFPEAAPVEIVTLLPPGASPHTFAPRPADAHACERAALVVMVDPNLDGWAARLAPAERRLVLMNLLPTSATLFYEDRRPEVASHHGDHRHSDAGTHRVRDPHFWTDPLAVHALLKPLAERLATADPALARFIDPHGLAAGLDSAHGALTRALAPVRGRSAGLFHPSFNYLFQRYGLTAAGLIEPIPGKLPTPRDLLDLTRRLRAADARAIFTEPQLPRRPAELLAETSDLPLHELDPLGGSPGIDTLPLFYEHNARILAEALQ